MLLQELRIKVVVVHVRNIQIGGASQLLAVDLFIAGKWEPRSEVGGIEPGIAEDTSMPGFNKKAGLSQERNLQYAISFSSVLCRWLLSIRTYQALPLYQLYRVRDDIVMLFQEIHCGA